MTRSILIFTSLLVLISLPVLSQEASEPEYKIEWKYKAELPDNIGNHVLVTVNDKIYVLGGRNYEENDHNKYNYMYDPLEDKWTVNNNNPYTHSNHACVTVDGKIYTVGGNSNSEKLEVYDPVTEKWDLLAPIPTPRQHINYSAAAVGNKIYVFGGIERKGDQYLGTINKLEVFDILTGKWEEKAPMPVLRQCIPVAAFNNKIYLIGGLGADYSDHNDVFMYDPAADKYTKLANLPVKRMMNGVAVIDDKIFVTTGVRPGQTVSKVFVYDPEEDKWSSATDLPEIFRWCDTVSWGGKLYVVGKQFCLEGTISENK
ncbi:MAG: hypothetical protein GY863_13295 [bacterium]|nr:hypothetical protein [bacterium]